MRSEDSMNGFSKISAAGVDIEKLVTIGVEAYASADNARAEQEKL